MKRDVHAHYIPESCLELVDMGPEPDAVVGDMTDLGFSISEAARVR